MSRPVGCLLTHTRTHGCPAQAGLDLSMGADPEAGLTGVYAAARHCLENDDPVSWLSWDAAAAAPPRR